MRQDTKCKMQGKGCTACPEERKMGRSLHRVEDAEDGKGLAGPDGCRECTKERRGGQRVGRGGGCGRTLV